jgi:hypothetical protein
MSLQNPTDSPQRNFKPFGQWLNAEEAAHCPLRQDFTNVILFITGNDPTVEHCLQNL